MEDIIPLKESRNNKLMGKNLTDNLTLSDEERIYNKHKNKIRLNMKDKFTQIDFNNIDLNSLSSEELEALETLYKEQQKNTERTKNLLDKFRNKKNNFRKKGSNAFSQKNIYNNPNLLSTFNNNEKELRDKINKLKREGNKKFKINKRAFDKQLNDIDNKINYDKYSQRDIPNHHKTEKFYNKNPIKITNLKSINIGNFNINIINKNIFNRIERKENKSKDSTRGDYLNIIMPSNPFGSVLKAHEDNFFSE